MYNYIILKIYLFAFLFFSFLTGILKSLDFDLAFVQLLEPVMRYTKCVSMVFVTRMTKSDMTDFLHVLPTVRLYHMMREIKVYDL